MEGDLLFKIDWASLTFGSKFTVFALFYFVFGGNFPSTSPPGGGSLYLRGDLMEGFFTLPVWGASIWRGLYMNGLFSEFYGNPWDLSQSKTEIYFDRIECQ